MLSRRPWGRKHNVLYYYDDAELVLSIIPDFPEHRRGEILSLAFLIRKHESAMRWLMFAAHLGFRFTVTQ